MNASATLERLRARARATSFAQAARVIEQLARRQRPDVAVGEDVPPTDEPLRFVASERMALVSTEVAEVQEGQDGQPRIVANVMGLVGATPALPPFYSEMQLQRRRLRDRSMAAFLNLFDHRSLSFFYRITRKYHWLLDHERTAPGERDAATAALMAYAGLATPAMRDRLGIDDAAVAPLAHHLGDQRRSAQSVQTVLRHLLRRPLRVVEAEPVWMALPPEEQTRLGGPATGCFARLGGEGQDEPNASQGDQVPDAALIGAAVLDVQHHYVVELGPMDHRELIALCRDDESLGRVRELCRLAAGIEYRPILRATIRAGDVPPLRLGDKDSPALLARTTWMGLDAPPETLLSDCTIPLVAGG